LPELSLVTLKDLFTRIINFGTDGSQSAHELRKVRTTNLLNLVAFFFVLLSYSNYFTMGTDFAGVPVTIILSFSLLCLVLSAMGKSDLSFLLLNLYVNFAIFYFGKYHPVFSGTYLYYFPLIVSVVLLNNPYRGWVSLLHYSICVAFFIATLFIQLPGFPIQLEPEKIRYLRMFNLIGSVSITAILSFLLTRLISKQNDEIIVQNQDLKRTKEAVNQSLKEKEILLAELHHRVKNNLAIISGLLNLQDDATTNEEAKEIIGDSKARIMSMALVHKMLYENANLKSLDVGQYTSELVSELFNSYDLLKQVTITQHYDKIILPVSKSIPLGLILNEIVTNSIKYVFKSKKKERGEFFISIKENNNHVTLIVKDNGRGFPSHFNAESETLSLGIYLIKTLSEQIDGKVRFSNDNGAKIEINFDLN
jgi:two-component sensor histidine kinase